MIVKHIDQDASGMTEAGMNKAPAVLKGLTAPGKRINVAVQLEMPDQFFRKSGEISSFEEITHQGPRPGKRVWIG